MKAVPLIPFLTLILAAGALNAAPLSSTTLGGKGQDFATSVVTDARGNTYVAGLTFSVDFPVTPGAAQVTFGGTSDVFVAKLSPEGKIIWATYLGGVLNDWATGLALDKDGNVLVTGYTRSPNFPLSNAVQSTMNNLATSTNYDAFLAKLDPDGKKLLYSTFLGEPGVDGANAVAVDAAGNAYIAASVQSAVGFPGVKDAPDQSGIVVTKVNAQGAVIFSFFHPYGAAAALAVDAAGSAYIAGILYSSNPNTATKTFGPAGTTQAMVFKVSPDGSQKMFETTLGGSVQASAAAIALNAAGEVYVAGSTSSVDFPVVRPLQSTLGARPLWKSSDSGANWAPLDDLPFALPRTLIVDPSEPKTVYAATGDLGIFKSVDAGVTWTKASAGIESGDIKALAIDPVRPQNLYAATATSVYKTTNGAGNWMPIDSLPSPISQLAIDAQNPAIVYEIGNALRKSTDAGATWNPVPFPGTIRSIVFDPRVSGVIFAVSNPTFCGVFCSGNLPGYFYRSVDGGANWIQSPAPRDSRLFVDASTNPTTIYAGLASRSLDGGVTWTPVNPPPGRNPETGVFAVDAEGTFYNAPYADNIFVSRDHAQTWTATGSPVPPTTTAGMIPSVTSLVPNGAGMLFALTNYGASSGFVTKLSADGTNIAYSTYLRGHPSPVPYPTYSEEPSTIGTQNWISAITLDAAGNATVAGGSRSADFPLAAPAQAANAGLADAFTATISADGSKLSNSTYFGGSQDDGALAVALDSQGNVVLAGQTWSGDFPISRAPTQPTGFGDVFVVKLAAPGPPVITYVLNAADFQPGIEAGSWVAIKGVNLSNTYPGRTWRTEEIVDGNLPTSLDGVRVSINGKPAFVYYLSPTQINVQAPSDSAVGAVDVVVDNNGSASAPVEAQLQEAAPAFFTYPDTNYAIASRLPDYALVGDATVPAKPGDTLVLWGTGFGATNPAAGAGATVRGAPAVITAPTVIVGGISAKVISTVLTAGSVGLYQITIQVPATMPAGAVPIQASIGSVKAQPVLLLVSE